MFDYHMREARYWERRAYIAASIAMSGCREDYLFDISSAHYAARAAYHYEQCALLRNA